MKTYFDRLSGSQKWLMGLIVVATIIACLPHINAYSEAQIDAGLQRSFISFAVARGLNGVISLIQSIEVDFILFPAFNPGELLDPLNDLVESFSDLMLLVTVVYSIEKLVLGFFDSNMTAGALTVLAFAWAGLKLITGKTPELLTRIVVFALVLRFLVPVTSIATEAFYNSFLQPVHVQNEEILVSTKSQLAKLSDEELDLSLIESITDKAEQGVESTVMVMATFVFQVVLMPMLSIWLLWLVARRAIKLGGS